QIYNLKWAFESGTYDEETRTTQLDYKGSAHWLKYKASELGYEPPAGYTGEPDPYILDLTMSDPEVTISRDSAVVSAVVKSRDQRTWEIVDYGRVPLVNLEAVGVTPTTAGGTTSWSEIPAAVTEAGAAAFAGFYRVGAVVDPVSFSYTGPGGAPDFSEHFDEEGAPSLKLAQNSLFYEGDEPVEFAWHWLDEDHLVTHSFRNVVIDGQPEVEIQTFDLNQMQPLGEPVFIPRDEAPNVEGGVVAYDTSQDRLLYHGRSEEGITRWLSFDPQTGAPATGSIDDARLDEPGVLGEPGFENLAWDPTRDEGWRIEGDWNCLEGGDGDSAECQWQLLTFKEDPDGTWTKHSYPVPGFGPGQIEGGYKTQSNFTNPIYATASDGSLIVLAGAREGRDPGNPVPERVPVAYRLTLDEAAETVQAEPFPLTAPGEDWVSDEFFDWVKTAANGQILLINGGGPIARCQIVTAGGVDCDGRVNPNQSVEQVANSFDGVAVDPQDGTVWYRGRVTQKLAAFRDGAYLGGAAFKEITSRGGPILVGSDHTIYALTTDGAPAVFGGSKTWGWGKFELLGYVPTVTGQPADASVTLGAGEGSKAVTFTAAATGQPAPTRQWQVKTPGASRFTDLAGQTAETLQVNAEPSTNGSEYRAVFTDAAGRVAGDAAELAVEYAPRVTLDLGDASATAGHDAVFSVVADGNPEPTITWQRRVAGFWEDITGADDGFVDGGTTLTVTDTNTDQTGALFRAKITNPAGTVFSRTATLTVTPAAAIPSQGVDVTEASLDWLGNEEVQSAPPAGGSNYLSAGVSAGTEASYHSVVGNAAVYQVSAGQEALATYATRAAHISDGGSQLARLYSGHGHINADGSGAIAWQGAFSVNFYGGAVPFTIEDPEIHFAGDGTGYLSADLAGCTSSQANPDQCAPFAPRSEAIIATFRGVTVDPTGVLTIDPDYAGVEVQVSAAAAGGRLPGRRPAGLRIARRTARGHPERGRGRRIGRHRHASGRGRARGEGEAGADRIAEGGAARRERHRDHRHSRLPAECRQGLRGDRPEAHREADRRQALPAHAAGAGEDQARPERRGQGEAAEGRAHRARRRQADPAGAAGRPRGDGADQEGGQGDDRGEGVGRRPALPPRAAGPPTAG
ncbi:MAG: HtaA domain-containing protein, partial [Actinobacteria bacterium]|nr:HtaA domain-containing protein [Actinomycetota bacterium]